jgi:hypothetical protein
MILIEFKEAKMSNINEGSGIGMQAKPWEDKERNGCVQGLIGLAYVLLIFLGLGGLIAALISISPFEAVALVIGLVCVAVSVVLLVILTPQLKIPASFKPRIVVPPNVLGQPFDVRFQPKQRLNPIGTVAFTPYGVHIEGIQEASTGTIFMVGWLISTAFRKKFVRDVPYQYISTVGVEGKKISLMTPTEEPNLFIFRCSMMDGERMYRELYAHFPNSVAQWAHLFVGQSKPPAPPSIPAAG